jgi:ABC-type antimicrobial peptide transport system permease subunit
MDEVVDRALTRPRFHAATAAIFAVIATLLAVFGIYGAVTSAVVDRRRELGVRLALGATPADILRRAASYGAMPTLLGLTAGIPLAMCAGWIVRQQLYGVRPTDARTLAFVFTLMTVVTLVAALVPAMNAMRIDAAAVLNHETQ